MPHCECLDEVNPQGVFLRPRRGKSVQLFMKNKNTKCGKSQKEWINMLAGTWISPQMILRGDSDRRASWFLYDFSAHDCCFGPSVLISTQRMNERTHESFITVTPICSIRQWLNVGGGSKQNLGHIENSRFHISNWRVNPSVSSR